MAAIEIGRVCIKTLGREAGNTCVIVDILDKNFVLIDGNV
ncbi:KOW motif-containing protein, partial [Methanocaldococcus sp.]